MQITLIPVGQPYQAGLSVAAGSVCAIAAMSGAQPGRLLWSILLAAASALPEGQSWLLTSAVLPAALAAPPGLAVASTKALAQGKIKILRHRLNIPSPRQARTMLAEFDYFGVGKGSLLVADCDDRWFDRPGRAGRPPLIASLQQWAQRRQVAVVLMFHAEAGKTRDQAAALLGFARYLSGIARIAPGEASGDTRLSCNLLFWFGPTAVAADARLPLMVRDDGMVEVDADAAAVAPTVQQVALDTGRVIALRSALAGSGGAPEHWDLCDTLEEVIAACSNAQAATVILAFERTTPQDFLMQAVYHLRRQAGARLKIIVREVHVRMRYNEEALIARLGANLIAPMEVSYARFLSMMEMVQSQIFGATLPATYEQALAAGLPQQEAGYLAPRVFADTVRDSLARSRTLAIDNVLVRLALGNGLSALDAMRHCTIKRAGDVYSGDANSVMVFLFACREIDASQTLERIFALPVADLFSSEHRYISNVAATSAIEEFGRRAVGGRLPDLTLQLRQIAALRAPDNAVRNLTLPVAAVGPVRRPAPPAPIATALRLRDPGAY